MKRSASSPPSISCIIPAYNEAAHLAEVVAQILRALRALSPQVELIVVNDGSSDSTAAVARELGAADPAIVLLNLSRNFGKEAALTAGLEAARGDVVVIMDGDGQHPASLLPDMLAHWRQGQDVVYAVRRTRADQSRLQVWLTQWFYHLINWGNRVKIPPHAGDFRLMDRKVVDAINRLPERNRFMKGLYAWVGYDSVAIDYEPLPRLSGHSRFGLRGSAALAATGFLSFSAIPLRLLGMLGLLLSVAAMGYGCWVVGEYYLNGISVPGYATIVVGMMFLSGIQLMSLGMLAEYVARIYEEVKQRPNFLVRERMGRGLAQPDAVTQKSTDADRHADTPMAAGLTLSAPAAAMAPDRPTQ